MRLLTRQIRQALPNWVYKSLLALRYAGFRKCCDEPELSKILYSDGSWVRRETTPDLARIETLLLKSIKDNFPSILQVGIGNSNLFASIGNKSSRFTGITIVEDEVEHSKREFPNEFGKQYDVCLMNKYSPEFLTIQGGFDYIIDNNISSYTCCKHHFEAMLRNYRNLLNHNGVILIGIDGVRYFDSGFGLTEKMLSRVALRQGLCFERGEKTHILYPDTMF